MLLGALFCGYSMAVSGYATQVSLPYIMLVYTILSMGALGEVSTWLWSMMSMYESMYEPTCNYNMYVDDPAVIA